MALFGTAVDDSKPMSVTSNKMYWKSTERCIALCVQFATLQYGMLRGRCMSSVWLSSTNLLLV